MNLITNADVKKFVTLLKAGLANGKRKELKVYTNGDSYDGTDITKNYFVSLEFYFHIDPQIIEALFIEEDAGLTSQIDEMLK